MAPTTSFVKVSKNSAVPIRIFTNRKELIKQQTSNQSPLFEAAISSTATTGHRALVRLRSASSIHLSNRQIGQLVQVLKVKLVQILFKDSVELLELQTEKGVKQVNKDKDLLRFIVNENGWKVRIYVSLKFIQNVRKGLVPDDGDAVNLMIRRAKELQSNQQEKETVMLQEEEEVGIPDEGEVIERLSDEKLVQKYDYKKVRVLGKGIKVELLQIPKRL